MGKEQFDLVAEKSSNDFHSGVLGFLLGLIWTTSAPLADSHPADGDPFTVPLSPQLEANFLGFTCVLIPLPFLFLSAISLSEELLLQWRFPK